MGSLVQTVLGKSLQAFRGMKTGTSVHFLSGTFLHSVFGIWKWLSMAYMDPLTYQLEVLGTLGMNDAAKSQGN